MIRFEASAVSARLMSTTAVVVVTSLLAGLAGIAPASARPESPANYASPELFSGRAVNGVKPLPVRRVETRSDAGRNAVPTRTAWPSAAGGVIELAKPSAGTRYGPQARVTGTPVWAQAAAEKRRYTGPERLAVRVLDRAAADAVGVSGILITVKPENQGGARGAVRVGVDYGGFAEAYGGNYGSRLRLVVLPACAVDTPELAACRAYRPLASKNDRTTRSVSADVPVDTAEAAGTVLALTAGVGEEGGEGGTYGATDLKPSGSWSAGGSTGSFAYSYPIAVPPVPSSLAAGVALSYDSGGVDGQTASTQAQASWVGDGWSLPRSYIEQTFVSCKDSPGGSPSPVATPDRCYHGPVLTISLSGSTTALVWDEDQEVWKPKIDDGSLITHETNTSNGTGTYNTDYWRVTRRDGTIYEFGRNQLPGWSAGKPTTNSVDHTPVYSAHPEDPCYNSAGFSASVCTMAYRWNLDYVKDVYGNALAYYYKQDANYYGRNQGATDVSYIRDSYLDRIDYGFTDGNAYGTVPNQVLFGTGPRCVAVTCTPLNSSTKANWPDVPYDLICAQGTDCDDWSPSFFSTVRLTSITVQQYSTASAQYEPVDSYALSHTIPATGDGTSPTLWLASITRTGHDLSGGGSIDPISLPPLTFGSIKLQNRVDTAADGMPALYRHRLATITTESGSVISASYERPLPCTSTASMDPATNTRSCFPVYWTPDGAPNQIRDWFNKYAVTRVTSTDITGGAGAISTSYRYLGGAAWRYDENEVVKAKYRTYGQFRGYAKVQTLHGDGVNDRQTLSEVVYYRGMSRNNSSTVVNLTDSAGGVHEDRDELAGKILESTSYLGDGGPVESSDITSYWVSASRATRERTGLPDLQSTYVAPAMVYSRQAVSTGGNSTWRYNRSVSTYETSITSPTFGLLKHTYTHTVPVDPAYDRCNSLTYAPVNQTLNLVGLVSETDTVSVACGGFTEGTKPSVPAGLNTLTAPTSVNRPAQVVSNSRAYYDDPTFNMAFPQPVAPTKGSSTMTRKAIGWASGAYTYQTIGRTEYDSYGRPVATYDGNGNKTTTTYTMNSVGLTVGSSVENVLDHSSSRTISPVRGLPLTETDANGVVTRQQFDALGRATSVWLHSRPTSAAANLIFGYQVSNSGPTATTTQKMNDFGGYQTSTTLYDSLLRPRQSQAMTPQGGRMIIDTFYDTRGWVSATYNGWWDDDVLPNTEITTADDLDEVVLNQTLNTYDGLGRAVKVESARDGVVISSTTTVYNGDRTTVIPPTGGVTTATVVDPIGRTKELIEYSVLPTLHAATDLFTGRSHLSGGTQQVNSFGYDGHGNRSTITDPDGNTWTTTYNLLGQVTSKTDPDAGAVTGLRYDNNGNLIESTDARQKTISFTYDGLNRKTGSFAAAVEAQAPGNQLASWVFDNANNAVPSMTFPIGKLTTSTAYWGGAPYVRQQAGFNVFGSSLGETVTIPAAEGALAGSYTINQEYTLNTGLPQKTLYPSQGGLPKEDVQYGYKSVLDLPNTVGSLLASYNQLVNYDAFGRINQARIGGSTNFADITNIYDDHNHRLLEQSVRRSVTTPAQVDKQEYRYDLAGNITRQISTRLGSPVSSETRCYQYDNLRRLAQAWTALDGCAAMPTPTSRTMVGNNLGLSSAYWTKWEFDPLGNRTQQTQYSLTGGADTVTTYAYDGNGDGQPNTLTSTTTTGGSTGSTAYAYDESANMTSRIAGEGNQTLVWNDAGQLVGVTGGTAGSSTFLYDANGTLLLQKDPGKTILYLNGQQHTLNTATSTVTGIRYHQLPGGQTAIRTGSGTNYSFVIPDQHGTPTLYLDRTAQTPTWRQFTPYGAPRGPAATVPDNRGFLNKPLNQATGLTQIGARNYDPNIARFVSIDPIFNAEDPQSWNGFAYANNNPIAFSDPTGLLRTGDNEGYVKEYKMPGGRTKHVDQRIKTTNGRPSAPTIVKKNKYYTLSIRGDGRLYLNDYPIPSSGPGSEKLAALLDEYCAGGGCEYLADCTSGLIPCDPGYADMQAVVALYAVCGTGNCGNSFRKRIRDDNMLLIALDNGIFEGVGGVNISGSRGAGGRKGGPRGPNGEDLANGGHRQLLTSCKGFLPSNSFLPHTLVLMADGSTRKIKDVRVGDRVLATDPENGETGSRVVTAEIVGSGSKNLIIVTVDTDGANGTETGVLTATDKHPFWVDVPGRWTDAKDLRSGDLVRTPDGSRVRVTGTLAYTAQTNVYNLSVEGLHTYYVLAGSKPVLVHNTSCAISMDNALDQAAAHVGDNPMVVRSGSRGVQFISVTVDAAGNTVRKIARFDVNPNSPHVQQWGPHLNLETQINGRTVTSGPQSDPHTPIDPSTIRNGDWWD